MKRILKFTNINLLLFILLLLNFYSQADNSNNNSTHSEKKPQEQNLKQDAEVLNYIGLIYYMGKQGLIAVEDKKKLLDGLRKRRGKGLCLLNTI